MINFRDKSYIDRRRILRQYYVNDKNAHKIVKTLAFEVKKKLINPISDLIDHEIIISYLIDGYLAFEVCPFYNRLIELDPDTLQLSYDNLELKWIQYPNTNRSEKFEYDRIIYITYDIYESSFLSSVYEGLIDITDETFILNHVDFIVDKLSNRKLRLDEIKNLDVILTRGLKIKKLKRNYEQLS